MLELRPRRNPTDFAQTVGVYVKAFLTILGWMIIATAAVAAGYVAVRIIYWAVVTATEALGL